MFMNAAQVSHIKDVCVAFGIDYQTCREQGRLAGHLVFPVRTKVHKMQHLQLCCEVINPIYVQCYAEESLIGTSTKVWKKPIAGRWKRVAQRNVLVKRLTALLIRFHDYAA